MAVVVTAEARIISVPGQVATIQSAIENATAGDTVSVAPGDYTETITIRKSVQLVSLLGSKRTHILAADAAKPVISITDSQGVSIVGFGISGSRVAGIYLRSSGEIRLRDNRVYGNGYGIFVQDSAGNIITGNIIDNNETGLYLNGSDSVLIENNSIAGNDAKGILFYQSDKNRIIGNSVDRNYWDGIMLMSSSDNEVRMNEIRRNTYSIVQVNSERNNVGENKTMRRLNLVLPVIFIYIGILFYFIEKTLFYYMARRRSAGRH